MLFTDLRSCTDRSTQTADSLTTAKGNQYVRSEKCEKAAFGDFTFWNYSYICSNNSKKRCLWIYSND